MWFTRRAYFSLLVVRPPDQPNPALLREACISLKSARYKKYSLLEELPQQADCLTSIFWAFQQANIILPLYPIGDLPRMLTKVYSWKIFPVSQKECKPGDLLFVKEGGKKRLLSHVAVVVSSGELFHCSQKIGEGTITSFSEFFSNHEQKLSLEESVHYIDVANRALRSFYQGAFVSAASR